MTLSPKWFLLASVLLVAGQATGQATAEERTSFRQGSVDRSRSFAGNDSRTTTPLAEQARSISPSARLLTGRDGDKTDQTRKPGSLWTTFIALGLVLGIILVTARLWKKHGPRLAGGLSTDVFDVLGKRHIDSKQSVLLLRLGSRLLLVGSSAQGLVTLAEVDDPVEVDFLSGLARRSNEPTPTIADSFRSLLNRQTSPQTPKFAPGPDDDNLQIPGERFSIADGTPPSSNRELGDG